MIPFSAWRARHLLVSWSAYWIALLLALVGPAIPSLWRVSRPDAQGAVSASAGNGILRLIVTEGSATAWTGDIQLLTLALLVAAPPLAIWALWLRAHRRQPVETERATHGEL